MPRLLGIDVETTGLDIDLDKIIRIGLIIAEANSSVPLKEWDMVLWDSDFPIKMPIDSFAVHGISMEDCKEFGMRPDVAFRAIADIIQKHRVKYLVGHNSTRFDLPFLVKKAGLFSLERVFQETSWIDTSTDIPFLPNIQTRKLSHLAVDHGIFNPLAHNALSDVHTMLSILAKYDFNQVVERAASPAIFIKAHVDFERREFAKRRRFNWESCDGKIFPKTWVKAIKTCDIDKERTVAEFEISIIS